MCRLRVSDGMTDLLTSTGLSSHVQVIVVTGCGLPMTLQWNSALSPSRTRTLRGGRLSLGATEQQFNAFHLRLINGGH